MSEAITFIDEATILEQKKKAIHEQVTWQFALALSTGGGPGAVTESYADRKLRGERIIDTAKAYADAWVDHIQELYDQQKANGDLEDPA